METGISQMPKPASEYVPDTQITPDPLLEKRTRRQFPMQYKLRIIAEADACKHGELGALLRREKLYSNQIRDWRKQLAAVGEKGLSKTAPGPAPSKSSEQREIEKLRSELARTQRKLEIAEGCIELQKKLSHLLEQTNKDDNA